MPNSEKISAVGEITEHFSSSSAAVITEYRGLTVKQITDLRRALGRDTTYAVVKNTLTKRAAAEAGSTRAVTEREADDLVRDADRFLGVVEQALGLTPHAPHQPCLPVVARRVS